MAVYLKNFVSAAQRLSRNPLGIIALFQVLIYAIAGLVTASVASKETQLLAVLAWFLVLFPVAVLVAFTYLVACHHQKLYAPSDFSDEANFMRSLEQGLARSRRFTELEEVTKRIKQELDSLPLFVFAKLPVPAQVLLRLIYLAEEGLDFDACLKEVGGTEDRKGEYRDGLRLLKDEIGWFELRQGRWTLSPKGQEQVASFIELTIARWI